MWDVSTFFILLWRPPARYAFPRARSQSSLAALSFNLNPCARRRYPRWVVLREDSRYPQTKIKRGKKDSVSVGERANISSPTVPLFSTFLNDAQGYNDLNKHRDAGTHWNSCFFIIIIFCTYLYRGYSVEFSCRSTNCTCIIIAWFSTILLVSISSWTSSARKRQCLDTRWQLRSVALSKRPETHSTTLLTAPAGFPKFTLPFQAQLWLNECWLVQSSANTGNMPSVGRCTNDISLTQQLCKNQNWAVCRHDGFMQTGKQSTLADKLQ